MEKSYIKDSCDYFINKIKSIHSISKDVILVRADILNLYSSVLYKTRLKEIRQTLEKKRYWKDDIVEIVGFKKLFLRSDSK